MTAKEYFQQVTLAERRLKILQAKLRHYEDLGLTITSNTSAVGGHHAGASRVEAAAIGMADATATLTAEIEQYAAQIAEAQSIIDEIPQERYRQILTLRYLCGWSLRSISDECRYQDPNSIYRAHGWALVAAQRIINQRELRA